AKDTKDIVELAMPYLIEAGRIPEDMDSEKRNWAEQVVALYHEQLRYGQEIVELTELFFKEEMTLDDDSKKVLEEEQSLEVLQVLTDKLIHLDDFSKDEIKAQIKATQKETGHRGKKLFMPIRVATTGQMHGPELPLEIGR